MKTLSEIVRARVAAEKLCREKAAEWTEFSREINAEIERLRRLEAVAAAGVDIAKVQLAETILVVEGQPSIHVDGRCIADEAIRDLATGCRHLKKEFFGNKRYDSYYQACDCSYGMGPRHGSIVDEVGLNRDARGRELTAEETDACIYYLMNYSTIKLAKQPKVTA